MDYRKLPKGTEQVSVIGLGCGYIHEAGEKGIEETLRFAVENGINYFDMAASEVSPYLAYGKVLREFRDKVYLQVHFGADYETGKYGWTTNLEKIKQSVDWQLSNLGTDYIDFGFVHCIDQPADIVTVMENGVVDMIQAWKEQGIIRHIALSTHTPLIANQVLDLGFVDLVMFSINPAYDFTQGDYAFGNAGERADLYRRCEAKGVGISVMKPFDGGILLDAASSPFGKALTQYQCIKYALDKPGVLTVLPGVRGKADLNKLLGYFNASDEEKDYSVIATFAPQEAQEKCVYCSHCAPCPQGLDIALINKYYDLALAGDAMARNHYLKLAKKARECVSCGHCNRRCPFHVDQIARMKGIMEYFGE